MSIITTKLNVSGMSCSHCEKAIQDALSELAGVSDTVIDLKEKTVTIEYDDSLLIELDLAEAIEDAGYDVV